MCMAIVHLRTFCCKSDSIVLCFKGFTLQRSGLRRNAFQLAAVFLKREACNCSIVNPMISKMKESAP